MSKTFATPQKLCRYSKNSFRFVYNNEIEVGDKLVYGATPKGESLSASVVEIEERRPSMGTFAEGERPFSYKLTLDNK